MADDEDDDDVLDVLEATFVLGADEATIRLKKAWLAFDSEVPPPKDGGQLREPAGADLCVVESAFGPDDDECTRATREGQAEVERLTMRGFLQRFALIGLMTSIAGLYTQWVYLLKDTEDFRFVLSNTWPLLIFAGMLFGLCIEQAMRWVGDQALALWQWWRFNMLFSCWRAWRRAPKWQHTYCCCWRCKHNKRGLTRHFNHCCCARCKFKRHWTYWKRFKRYPKGWKRHT